MDFPDDLSERGWCNHCLEGVCSTARCVQAEGRKRMTSILRGSQPDGAGRLGPVAICMPKFVGKQLQEVTFPSDRHFAAINDTYESFPVLLMLRRMNGGDELRGVDPFVGSANGIAGLSSFSVLL